MCDCKAEYEFEGEERIKTGWYGCKIDSKMKRVKEQINVIVNVKEAEVSVGGKEQIDVDRKVRQMVQK